jgi:hypothetical protein
LNSDQALAQPLELEFIFLLEQLLESILDQLYFYPFWLLELLLLFQPFATQNLQVVVHLPAVRIIIPIYVLEKGKYLLFLV